MIWKDFEPSDFEKIKFQPWQNWEKGKVIIPQKEALTLIDGEEIMAIVWYEEIWKGRFFLYSLISAVAGKKMLKVVRWIKCIIDVISARKKAYRLEFTVVKGFEQGVRMAKILGFECEGCLRKLYNGMDFYLFARV